MLEAHVRGRMGSEATKSRYTQLMGHFIAVLLAQRYDNNVGSTAGQLLSESLAYAVGAACHH